MGSLKCVDARDECDNTWLNETNNAPEDKTMYKILGTVSGCNTARMYRVTRFGNLVAMFLSHDDALAYIESKKANK
jgi:hypothetical protein